MESCLCVCSRQQTEKKRQESRQLNRNLLQISKAGSPLLRQGVEDMGVAIGLYTKETSFSQLWLRALDCKLLVIVIGVLPIFKGISIQ